MQNFDTSVGESHNKSQAKKPAKTTQKRIITFELQTATRQIENLSINWAFDSLPSQQSASHNLSSNIKESKRFRYMYHPTK